MKHLLLLILLCATLASCGASRDTRARSQSGASSKAALERSDRIVRYATSFVGTRYRFGGTSKKGIDCSGLVYTAFLNESIPLPRISRDMARSGVPIRLNQVDKGDLLFFKTGKNSKTINHVGLVVEVDKDGIRFIHSTTSKGVIISSLHESYWQNSFVEVRRVI